MPFNPEAINLLIKKMSIVHGERCTRDTLAEKLEVTSNTISRHYKERHKVAPSMLDKYYEVAREYEMRVPFYILPDGCEPENYSRGRISGFIIGLEGLVQKSINAINDQPCRISAINELPNNTTLTIAFSLLKTMYQAYGDLYTSDAQERVEGYEQMRVPAAPSELSDNV